MNYLCGFRYQLLQDNKDNVQHVKLAFHFRLIIHNNTLAQMYHFQMTIPAECNCNFQWMKYVTTNCRVNLRLDQIPCAAAKWDEEGEGMVCGGM